MPTAQIMKHIHLKIIDMANGGAAIGRDENDRIIFVPLVIPGEIVEVEIVEDKNRFARGRPLNIVESSPERVEPRCAHFGICGGCHFQHIDYHAQLRYKEAVVRDQLERIGGLLEIPVKPIISNPAPWAYAVEATFYPAKEGKLGYWSTSQGRMIPIETCHIIQPSLLELFQDVDLILPGLRSLTLRVDDGGALLAALELSDLEPPSLETDIPISVAIVFPDGTAVNLVGDNYLIQSVKGHDFRVSAGCFFYPSLPAVEMLVESVMEYVALSGNESLLELYAGVGTMTAFLARQAKSVIGIERNPDAIVDASVNLNSYDNVVMYEGAVEDILPLLDVASDVMVVDPPPAGLAPIVVDDIDSRRPDRLVYVSSDVATLARDGGRLAAKGYRPAEVQPIDMYPQSYRLVTVSLWTAS